MITIMSDAEVKQQKERIAELFQSRYVVDNLTAILMSTESGGQGLWEATARAKAHKIVDWLRFRSDNDALNNRIAPDAPWLLIRQEWSSPTKQEL